MSRERRDYHRVLQPFPMRYRVRGAMGAGWTTVATMNVSAGGVRFIGPEAVDCGLLVDLEITLPNLNVPLAVQGQVIWTQMEASGATEHGVQFINLTQAKQMQIDGMVQFLLRPDSPPPTYAPRA